MAASAGSRGVNVPGASVAMLLAHPPLSGWRDVWSRHRTTPQETHPMSSLDQVHAAAADIDQQETQEWIDALEAVLDREGAERAHYLIERLIDLARRSGAHIPYSLNTAYVNTIPPGLEPAHPGNMVLEERIRSYIRWNAMAMVVKANKVEPPDGGSLGGHIASFASLATMIECGQNHFWHAESPDHGGDLIYFQGH